MADSPEQYYYLPHEGDIFGSQPGSSGDFLPEAAGSGPLSKDFDAQARLFYGQDPYVNSMIQLMRRDRYLSAFPDMFEGAKLLEKVLPEFIKLFTGGDQLSLPGMKYDSIESLTADKEKFFKQLLFDFFTGGQDQIEAGGQETLYIFNTQLPIEQSYEYIGEKVSRILRGQIHGNDSPRTQAFFGWIGRHLMKRMCPETDFSLDRHIKRVADDKAELAEAFTAFQNRLKEGVDGDLTHEKAIAFFNELGKLSWLLPKMTSAETPTQLRVGSNLSGHSHYIPYQLPDFMSDSDYRSFPKFMKYWRSEEPNEISHHNDREEYKKAFPEIFRDIPTDDDIARALPEEFLLPKWFVMITSSIKEEIAYIAEDGQNFTVSYFRFIGNKDVAAGYAYAEAHIDEIFDTLPAVLCMTEEEVQALFMQGDPHILYDADDYGENSPNDLYNGVEFEELGHDISEEEKDPPPIVLTYEERTRSDEDWFAVISHGPNASLYEGLEEAHLFSTDDWVYGVFPLFFGNWCSDREAEFFGNEKLQKEFHARFASMTPLEREKERIEELKTGVFSLPKTYEDLVINASRQLIRLQHEYDQWREQVTTFNGLAISEASLLQERMIAIRRVRMYFRDLIARKSEDSL